MTPPPSTRCRRSRGGCRGRAAGSRYPSIADTGPGPDHSPCLAHFPFRPLYRCFSTLPSFIHGLFSFGIVCFDFFPVFLAAAFVLSAAGPISPLVPPFVVLPRPPGASTDVGRRPVGFSFFPAPCTALLCSCDNFPDSRVAVPLTPPLPSPSLRRWAGGFEVEFDGCVCGGVGAALRLRAVGCALAGAPLPLTRQMRPSAVSRTLAPRFIADFIAGSWATPARRTSGRGWVGWGGGKRGKGIVRAAARAGGAGAAAGMQHPRSALLRERRGRGPSHVSPFASRLGPPAHPNPLASNAVSRRHRPLTWPTTWPGVVPGLDEYPRSAARLADTNSAVCAV
jgi:hypothetical protein